MLAGDSHSGEVAPTVQTPVSRASTSHPKSPRSASSAASSGAASSSAVRKNPFLISTSEFVRETTVAERELLRKELNEAIHLFLLREQNIYLETLGFLFPYQHRTSQSYSLEDSAGCIGIRQETQLRVTFEKCGELVPFLREKYSPLVDLKKIGRRVYTRLPFSLQQKWSEELTARYLRGLVKSIKEGLVVEGRSGQLSSIGHLYALHNRQGKNLSEWFSGADVFLKSLPLDLLAVKGAQTHPLPEVDDPWELLEAACGAPLLCREVDLPTELEALGYSAGDVSALASSAELSSKLELAAFRLEKNGWGEPLYIFSTRGVSPAQQHSTEALTIIPCKTAHQELESLFPYRSAAMVWLLQQSGASTLKQGAGLSGEASLWPSFSSKLCGILMAESQLFPHSFPTSSGGSLRFLTVLGLTRDEGEVAERYSSEYLLDLLSCRRLEQITRPQRTSIVQRTGLLPLDLEQH